MRKILDVIVDILSSLSFFHIICQLQNYTDVIQSEITEGKRDAHQLSSRPLHQLQHGRKVKMCMECFYFRGEQQIARHIKGVEREELCKQYREVTSILHETNLHVKVNIISYILNVTSYQLIKCKCMYRNI